jgi:hypothetical protein
VHGARPAFATLLAIAGLTMLATGIGGFSYSFKTGVWDVEREHPWWNRGVGIVLIACARLAGRARP